MEPGKDTIKGLGRLLCEVLTERSKFACALKGMPFALARCQSLLC